MRKSTILVSQDTPKTLPKTLPNQCSKKHTIFESIFDNICQNSKPQNLENINFASTGARCLRISQELGFANVHAFVVQKPYQKPSQNEVRNPKNPVL